MSAPTTYPHPLLATAPDGLLRPGNGPRLLTWCESKGIRPTFAHIETERRRRGLATKTPRAHRAGNR